MSRVNMKDLLESGAHFGHLTRRWNPKMKTYIYGDRNGIHIIDLHQTLKGIETACDAIYEMVLGGGSVLFVGTKKQAQEACAGAARGCGMFHVSHRWQGGMLTNFQTIRESIAKLATLEELDRTGRLDQRPKKEAAGMREQMAKLKRVLGGIEDMPGMPSVVFVVDVAEEANAVKEARRLRIPIVAVVDTNCDPEVAEHVIPCNDDAIRAIKLVCEAVRDAVIEAVQERESQIAAGEMRPNAIDLVRRKRFDLDPRLTAEAGAEESLEAEFGAEEADDTEVEQAAAEATGDEFDEVFGDGAPNNEDGDEASAEVEPVADETADE